MASEYLARYVPVLVYTKVHTKSLRPLAHTTVNSQQASTFIIAVTESGSGVVMRSSYPEFPSPQSNYVPFLVSQTGCAAKTNTSVQPRTTTNYLSVVPTMG